MFYRRCNLTARNLRLVVISLLVHISSFLSLGLKSPVWDPCISFFAHLSLFCILKASYSLFVCFVRYLWHLCFMLSPANFHFVSLSLMCIIWLYVLSFPFCACSMYHASPWRINSSFSAKTMFAHYYSEYLNHTLTERFCFKIIITASRSLRL